MSAAENTASGEISDHRENYGALYTALGDSYRLRDEHEPALSAYTKAQIQYMRLLSEVFLKKGKAYFSSGNYKSAFDNFQQSLSMVQDPETRRLLAEAAIELAVEMGGEREPACFGIIAGMIRDNAQDPAAFELLASFTEKMGCPSRAMQYRAHAGQLALQLEGDPARLADIRHGLDNLQKKLLEIQRKSVGLPAVIFSSLPYSGVSAIDPILRELLSRQFGYDLFASNHMSPYVRTFLEGPAPLYHWTHDGPASFGDLLGRPNTKFLFLHRDPRDVLVSKAKDYRHLGLHAELDDVQLYSRAAADMLPDLENALAWRKLDDSLCLKFNFAEMKSDIPAMTRKILAFLGLDPDPALLREIVDKHSFEAVTGRQQGQEGNVVRGKYLFRKGVSGEWRKAFTEEISRNFKALCGKYIIQLGYERDDNW